MNWITAADLLRVHARLIEASGGVSGVLNPGGVESALARPLTTVAGQAAFPDLLDKVSALMHAIIVFHPFVDGNKRLALVAGDLVLRLNGRRLVPSGEVEPFFWSIARGEQDVPSISAWLKAHCERYTRP